MHEPSIPTLRGVLPASIVPVAIALALAGCGAAASPPSAAPEAPAAARPLDWALLLPIETEGLVRLDLARMRRSSHRDALSPLVDELLSDTEDGGLRARLASLIDRTDLVLVALLPSESEDAEDEALVLARGEYAPDEIERLEAASGGGSRALELRGQRVWVGGDPEDTTALAQLRPDTLALTASPAQMERLIARTSMAGGAPRWPPSVRALVEATRLEQATFGVAFANRRMGPDESEPLDISLAGIANADGPLDVEVLVEVGDATLAAAGAIFLEAMIGEIARSAEGESFALGGLARLARVEASGTRIRGSIHADEAEARQLVPGLMGLLRDGLRGDLEEPDLISPLPTPL